MANLPIIKTLVNLHKQDSGNNGAFERLRQQATSDKNKWLLAHFSGADAVINGVDPSVEKLIARYEQDLKDLKGDTFASQRAAIKDMIANLSKVDWDTAKETTDAIMKGEGTSGARDKLANDSVIYCAFSGDGAHYAFCHIDNDNWTIASLDLVARKGNIVVTSEQIKAKLPSDKSASVDNPSLARKVCHDCHKAIGGKDAGLASIVHSIEKSMWHNSGGVGGKSMKKRFGNYALVLAKTSATSFLDTIRKDGTIPSTFEYIAL